MPNLTTVTPIVNKTVTTAKTVLKTITPPNPTIVKATKTITTIAKTATKAPKPVHTTPPADIVSFISGLIPLILVAAIIVFLIVLIIGKLRRRGPRKGSYNLSDVSKEAPDAVLLTIDVDSKSIYWLPLTWQGGYYTYRVGKEVGVFVPGTINVFRCGKIPCYIAMKIGDVAVEVDPTILAKLNIAALSDKEIAEALRSPFVQGVKKLAGLVSELASREGKLPTEVGVAVDTSPQEILVDLARYLANMTEGLIRSLRSLSTVVMETGGAIEKKTSEPTWSYLLKYMPMIGVGLGTILLFWIIAQYFGARLIPGG